MIIYILNAFILILLIWTLWFSYSAFKGQISWGQARVMGIPSIFFLWIQVLFWLVLGADAFSIVSYILDFSIWIDIFIFTVLLVGILYIYVKLTNRTSFKPELFIPLVLVPLSIPGIGFIGKMTKSGTIALTETPIIKFVKTTTVRETTPAFRQGDDKNIKTIIFLSAPGQVEAKAGRPAAGETGKTLQSAIEILHKKTPKIFPSAKLDDYTIMNAVEDVHYKSKTGRTEGTLKEVTDTKNIDRINEILKDYDTVVALGNNAQIAVKTSDFKGDILSTNHPSKQALNKQYKSTNNTPEARNIDRIRQWTETLIANQK